MKRASEELIRGAQRAHQDDCAAKLRRRFEVPRALRGLRGSLAAMAGSLTVDGRTVLSEVATDLYCGLNTPVSLSCEIMLRYGDIAQLVQRSVDPRSYNCPTAFRDDYQAVNFLRKTPFVEEGLDPGAAALSKFREAEEQCRATNARIRSFLGHPERAPLVVQKAYCLAIGYIREVLGDSVSSSEWLHSCRFGPGAFNHPSARGLTSIYDKLQIIPAVTADFRAPGAKLVMSSPSWARSIKDVEDSGFWPFVDESDLVIQPGNRVTFVPKTATTERAIAIEPLVNVYAQLGLGRMIRNRLKAFAHIDLNDQSINQDLAREGSIRGFLSTIDLSSASDTVAREVVRSLLPDEWYSRLDVCRSKVGELNGSYFSYEKFSSMGNGFTFELETLIFWALSRSACVVSGAPEMVSVYGDDIIVPSCTFDTLVEILTFFGFTLNPRKSFRDGPFRESCGKDYYDGADVRPFLQEEVPSDLHQVLTLANGISRVASRRMHGFGRDLRLYAAWKRCLQAIPRSLRVHLAVPAHAGDSEGIIRDWDEAQASSFVLPARGSGEGWFGLRLTPVFPTPPKAHNFEGGVASLLYRARDGFGSDYSPADPRQGRDVSFELRDGAFYGPWTDLGPWI